MEGIHKTAVGSLTSALIAKGICLFIAGPQRLHVHARQETLKEPVMSAGAELESDYVLHKSMKRPQGTLS